MENVALLVIDMQNDFVLDGKPMRVAGARAVIPNVQAVLAEFRKRNLPIFHIIRVHRPDGSDVELIRKERFRKQPFGIIGSHGAAIIDELAPLEGEYVLTKTRMSAFIGTELDLMLHNLGIMTVFIVGIQTPNCIRTTVFDAIAYNHPVVLVDDAVGASSEEVHRANVRDMENIGVRMVKTAGIPDLLG